MIDYLQKARAIADKLAATSQATEENGPVIYAIRGLGPKYEAFVPLYLLAWTNLNHEIQLEALNTRAILVLDNPLTHNWPMKPRQGPCQ